ncbi:hypothetical protein H477_3877 [[Clostridium] sordellii ATCC 9714]|nr:hypothetical protein H477_3877 [[Clostridium] sordellii ATCC 9714] [Paeniclostridium sordellii ATCC 9714]
MSKAEDLNKVKKEASIQSVKETSLNQVIIKHILTIWL